jgi:hypothetical protein
MHRKHAFVRRWRKQVLSETGKKWEALGSGEAKSLSNWKDQYKHRHKVTSLLFCSDLSSKLLSLFLFLFNSWTRAGRKANPIA